ncbi:MAG: hypothetical protein ABL931_21795, partial [Usitatibacteraceae bacterium]
MSNYYKQAKEYQKSQQYRLRWVNVYDAWQIPVGGTSTGTTRIGEEYVLATWIKVASVADMVKQLRDVPDAEFLALRLHGVTKTRPSAKPGDKTAERVYYISVGQHDTNDTTGHKSLQLTAA